MDKNKFLEITEVDKYIKVLEQDPAKPALFPTFKKAAGAFKSEPGKPSLARRVGSMPVGKKLGVGALGAGALVGGGLYGAYRGIKGLAKGAVNAVRYPFRPYERQGEGISIEGYLEHLNKEK